jgi:hypothetical protein
MGWLYLGQDGCVKLALFRSGFCYEDIGLLYLGQDMGVSVWAGCI